MLSAIKRPFLSFILWVQQPLIRNGPNALEIIEIITDEKHKSIISDVIKFDVMMLDVRSRRSWVYCRH